MTRKSAGGIAVAFLAVLAVASLVALHGSSQSASRHVSVSPRASANSGTQVVAQPVTTRVPLGPQVDDPRLQTYLDPPPPGSIPKISSRDVLNLAEALPASRQYLSDESVLTVEYGMFSAPQLKPDVGGRVDPNTAQRQPVLAYVIKGGKAPCASAGGSSAGGGQTSYVCAATVIMGASTGDFIMQFEDALPQ
jgi:hypothetical protein